VKNTCQKANIFEYCFAPVYTTSLGPKSTIVALLFPFAVFSSVK
jgi:hypothetical protein